jgi:hypothetical protein
MKRFMLSDWNKTKSRKIYMEPSISTLTSPSIPPISDLTPPPPPSFTQLKHLTPTSTLHEKVEALPQELTVFRPKQRRSWVLGSLTKKIHLDPENCKEIIVTEPVKAEPVEAPSVAFLHIIHHHYHYNVYAPNMLTPVIEVD